jgi:hypothetical protein
MVLGRRRFTWRSDVRGLTSVAGLALATLLAASLAMGAILILSRLLDGAGT